MFMFPYNMNVRLVCPHKEIPFFAYVQLTAASVRSKYRRWNVSGVDLTYTLASEQLLLDTSWNVGDDTNSCSCM